MLDAEWKALILTEDRNKLQTPTSWVECYSYTIRIIIWSFVLLIFDNFKLFSNFSRPSIETTGKLPVENQYVHVLLFANVCQVDYSDKPVGLKLFACINKQDGKQ